MPMIGDSALAECGLVEEETDYLVIADSFSIPMLLIEEPDARGLFEAQTLAKLNDIALAIQRIETMLDLPARFWVSLGPSQILL